MSCESTTVLYVHILALPNINLLLTNKEVSAGTDTGLKFRWGAFPFNQVAPPENGHCNFLQESPKNS